MCYGNNQVMRATPSILAESETAMSQKRRWTIAQAIARVVSVARDAAGSWL